MRTGTWVGRPWREVNPWPQRSLRQRVPPRWLALGSQHQLSARWRPGHEARGAEGLEIDRRAALENELAQDSADRWCLHEAVAREAAGHEEPGHHFAEQWMRIRGHVVEAGPGAIDARARSRRKEVRESLACRGDESWLDALVKSPTRHRL